MKGINSSEGTTKQNDNKDVFLREFAGSLKEMEKRKGEKKENEKSSTGELFKRNDR